ncbi:unnamed protein product [Scytosiphon promiscuus]
MVQRSVRRTVVSSCALSLVALLASEPTLLLANKIDRHGTGIRGASGGSSRGLDGNEGGDADEVLVMRDGIIFQTEGCPQAITGEEALARRTDDSIPGNVVNLVSEGKGRAGNHFLTISAYLAMGYCCKTKVLTMPKYDTTIPAAASEYGGVFESEKHFFDFSGVDMLPLEEFEGLSNNPLICEPEFQQSGTDAFHLANIHEDLLSCMNRVYLRGCETTYLEPLLGTETFGFCTKPLATHGRRLSEDADRPAAPASAESEAAAAAAAAAHQAVLNSRRRLGEEEGEGSGGGSPFLTMSSEFESTDDEFYAVVEAPDEVREDAGSLVIHIRSGDIFRPTKRQLEKKTNFLIYGQPPLQYYLRAIASQQWSDVTILTFSTTPEDLNPTFAALEMMQRTGMLGPHVTTHKNRDLLTDIRAMLCADGLAIARSTLHFLTFAHTRAKHLFVPSECGPGYYARGTTAGSNPRKKPNPNNTTLLCIENPDAEVYGIDWEGGESSYPLYDNWDASEGQRLDMLLFDGVKGLSRCCAR